MEETRPVGSSSESAGRRVNDIDATGKTVAANLRRLRTMRRLTTAQLAERLDRMGRPIIANAITKIEQGRRRVDVDDLMTLAIALGVTPNTLLLPSDVSERVQPTGLPETLPGLALWGWACGEEPLPAAADPFLEVQDKEEAAAIDARAPRSVDFRREAAPHAWSPFAFMGHQRAMSRAIDSMVSAIEASPESAESVANLASKFGETWTILADKLREIVRRSNDIESAGEAAVAEVLSKVQGGGGEASS